MCVNILLNLMLPIIENLIIYLIFIIGMFSCAKFVKREDHYFFTKKKYIVLSAVVFGLIMFVELNEYIKFIIACVVSSYLFNQLLLERPGQMITFNTYVIGLYLLVCLPLEMLTELPGVGIKFVAILIFILLDKCIYKFGINKDCYYEIGMKNLVKYIIDYMFLLCGIVLCTYAICSKSTNISFMCNILMISALVFFTNLYVVKNHRLIKSLSYITELESNNKILTDENDRVRTFKHDFNNIIMAMNGYIQTEDIPSLKSFINKMDKDINIVEESIIGNKYLLNNKAILNLLNKKNEKAKKENIKIEFEIMLELNVFKDMEYEIIRILGVFLDNAIEAERDEDEKYIRLFMCKDGDSKKIICENKCSKDIDVDKIFEKSYSTKKGNTGLGLFKVHKMIHDSNNMSLYTTLDDNMFRHTVIVL